jgi:hypothetical protein
LDTLRKNRDLEASYILRNVQNAAEQFRLGEQEDDLTLVIARVLVLPNTFPSLAQIVRCKSARIGYPHLYAALIESGEHKLMRLRATTPVCPKGIPLRHRSHPITKR